MKTRPWIGAAVVGLILALVPVVRADASPASMMLTNTQVHITNRYPHQTQAIVAYRDSACTGWMVRGWFVIDSGDTRHVANTDRDYILFFAESNGDDTVWDGSVITVNVPNKRFGTCDTYLQQALPGTRPLGLRMRNFSPGLETFTISLVP
ncbi:DUF1036 domain-containing protein [Actinoplanes sp. NPDC049118]|uniref:DUF1036 domain-containing protein n=1 Tax=Actinoplanes sp. NPDC049118 TaxID=3155769 RepID=UPI00340A0F21